MGLFDGWSMNNLVSNLNPGNSSMFKGFGWYNLNPGNSNIWQGVHPSLDISKSALNTGAGTPWSAGNQNNALSYLKAGPLTGGLDLGGQGRINDDQNAAADADKAQKQADQQAAQQAAQAQQAADWAKTGQDTTNSANSLEQALMSQYLGQKQKGNSLFGGY